MDKSQIQKEKTVKKGTKQFAHEFNNVSFPENADLFRVTMKSVPEGVLLWLENKKTKQQWQLTITDVSECGPQGIPDEAVIAFLKRGFETRSDNNEHDESEKTQLELSTADGEVVFTLTLDVHGVWNPEFVFSLLPVGLEKVDILEAQVRDIQEENIKLRALVEQRRVAVFSVSSAVAVRNGDMVAWDAPAPRKITASHFQLSGDNKQVTIRVAGEYQVQVRLAVTNSANCTQPVNILVNDVSVAGCTQCDGNGYQNTSQVFEILSLEVDDTVQVRCNANSNSIAVALANRFTMLYLGI